MAYKAPMFVDRTDAGRRLAERLLQYKPERPIVLALPRGGVPVAWEITQAMGAPLDLILVRKAGVPTQPELAMGAIANGEQPELVTNEAVIEMLGITEAQLQEAAKRQLLEIERCRQRYLGDRPRIDLTGRTVIIVDDGIATGATVRAALRAVRHQKPARLILAIPVAPSDILGALRREADIVICLEESNKFFAISRFYANFEQLSDAVVSKLMDQSPKDVSPSDRRSA